MLAAGQAVRLEGLLTHGVRVAVHDLGVGHVAGVSVRDRERANEWSAYPGEPGTLTVYKPGLWGLRPQD